MYIIRVEKQGRVRALLFCRGERVENQMWRFFLPVRGQSGEASGRMSVTGDDPAFLMHILVDICTSFCLHD